jgi:hypothetical protein
LTFDSTEDLRHRHESEPTTRMQDQPFVFPLLVDPDGYVTCAWHRGGAVYDLVMRFEPARVPPA